jgi:O-antigen ligase
MLVVYHNEKLYIQSQESFLIAIVTIWFLYLTGYLMDPGNITQLIRALIYISISITTLFFIPNIISRYIFLRTVSLMATCLILVGLPGYFSGNYVIEPFGSTMWRAGYNISGYNIPHLTSIMANPNPLGKVSFFGLVSSYIWRDRRIQLSTAFTCLFGIILTGSRAAFLATFAGGLILISTKIFCKETLNRFIILSSVLCLILFLMLMGLIPGPDFFSTINLSHRRGIWNAGLEAALARPVLGHGPENVGEIVYRFKQGYVGAGIYNSFIRLFITTGIFGLLSYIYIYFYSIIGYLPDLGNRSEVIIYAIIIGYAVDELFSGNSIFGLSVMSVTASCLIGYIVKQRALRSNQYAETH